MINPNVKIEDIRSCPHSPNLFLVGAAKSGTTTLAEYLGLHPEIFVCPFKEPAFFVSYDGSVNETSAYLDLFRKGKNHSYRLDASTMYLFPPGVPELINRSADNAKILIVLRNPVKAAYSYWRYMGVFGNENKPFSIAISEDEQQFRTTEEFRQQCVNWWPSYLYVQRFQYYAQVKRYLDIFGAKRVKVLIFEEFIKNTVESLHDVTTFLEIEDVTFDTSLVSNEGGEVRSRFIVEQLKSPHPILKKLLPASIRFKLRERLKRVAIKKGEKAAIPEETLDYLRGCFRDDVLQLESLLGVALREMWEL